MITLSLEKIINFKNSEGVGRISYVLLPEKHVKLAVKLMCIFTFRKVFPSFFLKFAASLEFNCFPSIKTCKAISIAAS